MRAVSTPSMTSSWPTIIRPTSVLIFLKVVRNSSASLAALLDVFSLMVLYTLDDSLLEEEASEARFLRK